MLYVLICIIGIFLYYQNTCNDVNLYASHHKEIISFVCVFDVAVKCGSVNLTIHVIVPNRLPKPMK